MNDAKAAILEWKNKSITNFQLLRRLVTFDKWNVPISEAAVGEMLASNHVSRIQFHQTPDGQKMMLLYTDSEAYSDGFTLNGEPVAPQHFLTTTGACVFRQLMAPEFTSVSIDSGTPSAVLFVGAQVDGLREVATAVDIEGYLAQLRRGQGPDGCVRQVGEYRAYCIAVRKIDGQHSICYAPDDQHRKLIAVFTTDDAYDNYVARLPDEITDTMFQVKMPGPKLFDHLLKQPADGLVFNCCGPTKPVAFAPGLCGIILAELNAAPPK